MKINYNVQGPKRKELVKLIADFTGYEAKYCGAPTFAYEVGGYGVDKNGIVTLAPNIPDEAVERMIQKPAAKPTPEPVTPGRSEVHEGRSVDDLMERLNLLKH